MPCREGVEVFDITVADDHSFIADGQVVHNCDWGPLGSDGRPIKSKKGTYFKQFIGFLRTMGYTVSYKVLNAADYGDATTRRRLFIQARRGKHIKWPARSHAPQNEYANDGGSAWRPAREVIDWSIPGESIFSRKRPLCAATMRRIMTGLEKYSGLQPFLVKYYEGSDACSIDEPLPTITANYEHLGLCRPYVVVLRNHSDARSVDEPLPTITAGGNHVGLAKPFIIPYYSERDGRPRDATISTSRSQPLRQAATASPCANRIS
jgi:DNA (cytosine-5)-methyltransferase 1